MTTILAELIAYEDDFGYINYIFLNLESTNMYNKYILCTRYPNWQHRELKLGEIGFLTYREIDAGIDEWFDGTNFIPYRYSTVQFIKFIDKPEEQDDNIIINA